MGDDAIEAAVSGSITFPSEGSVANVVESHEFTAGTPGNYNVGYARGELTMANASAPITITAASDSKSYDGTPLASAQVSITSGELFPGDNLVASAAGSATNVADTAEGNNSVAVGYKVMNGDVDVTESYIITPAAGTLAIEPAKATITVANASKAQGGDDPTFTGTVEGLVAEGDLGAVKYFRANNDETVGVYEGVLDAEYSANPNYEVNVVKGNFAIKAVYTLRWLDGDGSVLQEKTFVEGEPAPSYDGEEPAKAATVQYSYVFTDWDEGTIEGSTTTYRPLFDESVNEYTVRFVNDDGTKLQSGQLPYGAMPEFNGKTPEKAPIAQYAYKFKGWDPEIAVVTGNATYTATYTETPAPSPTQKGTLTFDLAGGTIDGKTSLTIEADVGDVITIPEAPVRDGYTFKYWKGSEYYPGDKYTVEGDHAFTAVWEKKSDGAAAKAASPATGDPFAWAVTPLAIAAACALVLALLAFRRRVQRK